MIYEVEQLSCGYEPGKMVLDRVNLTVSPGEIVTILGPNGAGKSTLLNCLMGLLPVDQGTIRLEGKALSSLRERDIARIAGYVPQSHQSTFDYPVLDFVTMGMAPMLPLFRAPGTRERAAAEEALAELGLLHLAHRPYTQLSGGERQQVTVARAIVRRPKVVLFDEPTAHLDFGNQLRVLRLVRQLAQTGYAAVMTTHNPEHALLLRGTAAVLDRQGHLQTGPAETLLTESLLQQLYDAPLIVRYDRGLGRTVCLYPDL